MHEVRRGPTWVLNQAGKHPSDQGRDTDALEGGEGGDIEIQSTVFSFLLETIACGPGSEQF